MTTAATATAASTTLEQDFDTTLMAQEDTILSPRFYTTDFEEVDGLDVSSVRAEWDALLDEMESDRSQDVAVNDGLPPRYGWSGRHAAQRCHHPSLSGGDSPTRCDCGRISPSPSRPRLMRERRSPSNWRTRSDGVPRATPGRPTTPGPRSPLTRYLKLRR